MSVEGDSRTKTVSPKAALRIVAGLFLAIISLVGINWLRAYANEQCDKRIKESNDQLRQQFNAEFAQWKKNQRQQEEIPFEKRLEDAQKRVFEGAF